MNPYHVPFLKLSSIRLEVEHVEEGAKSLKESQILDKDFRTEAFSGCILFRRFSTDVYPPWDQYKSGEKLDQYVGGHAFYKHPKLPKNGQKRPFSAPEIHQNTSCL